MVRAERPVKVVKVQARNDGDLTKVVVVQTMRGDTWILNILGRISVP